MTSTQTTVVPAIASSMMGRGSFGLCPRNDDEIMTVWYCGAWILDGQTLPLSQRPIYMGNTSAPCVHLTRQAARTCARRRELQRQGR